ncbi:PQQ-binding-like beta-propeller repeat protein, partial [Chloroflexota bacterium]
QTTRISLAFEPSAPNDTADLDPSVDFVQIGLTGDIQTDIVITQLAGKKAVLLGTSKGLYIISEGDLLRYIATPGSVTDITVLNDINGDDQPEIVIALDDTRFPNIRCYDGASGDKLWHFASRQAAFLDSILWTDIETPTFDITTIADMNNDDCQDLAATSGYGLYVLDGKTGEQIWRFDAEDNLWQVTEIPDINGDGIKELAAGSQIGLMHVLDGAGGDVIWQERISEKSAIYDDSGSKWATVDTSVWDIVPIEVDGKEMAAVSSEDGKIRLVNLEDGSYKWESEALIDYSASLLYTYYSRNNKLPTSPGNDNFFNLRISIVDDISGDGTGDIIASTYAGQSGQQGTSSVNSGLFMLDSASGEIIWNSTELDLGGVAQIELASINGEQRILLPQEKSGSETEIQLVNPEDGQIIETLDITSPQSYRSSDYWAKEIEEDFFVTVSNYDDLLCISTEGEVQWYYPRITDVALERGDFTGDGTEDLFICSKQRLSDWDDKYWARILYVVDGATRSEAWSYEISYEDLADSRGITSILVTPDLDGDGKQDIAGYTEPQSSDGFGEGYQIMAFSGEDGTILINQPVINSTYYGIYEQLYEANDSENLNSTVDAMLTQGVQATYYDVYQGLDDKPVIKSQVDDFISKILTENGADYDPDWLDDPGDPNNPDDPGWFGRLEGNLVGDGNYDPRQDRTINKQIVSLDIMGLQGEPVLIIGCPQDVFILDSEGDLLWTRTYHGEAWVYQDPFTNVQPQDWWMKDQWDTRYLSLGDLNGDNIDDLLATSGQSISILISELDGDSLNFRNDLPQALTIYQAEPNTGIDPSQVILVDDIDGDGIKEVLYPIHQPDKAPLLTIVSTATGDILMQEEWQGGGQTSTAPLSADFDKDGSQDRIIYSNWREKLERPVVEIVSGNNGSVIWQYEGYQESWLLNNIGLTDIVPATPVSDQNGDEIPEIALLKFLHDQPGAMVEIYDVTKDELIKEITLESIDKSIRWDRRWNPGIAIEEVGDFNGDGTNELALVTMLTESDSGDSEQGGGQPGEDKEIWLMVVDVANEEAIAEFEIFTLQFIETENEKELAVVGVNGEIYFLNMESDFQITSPEGDSSLSSPVTIAWEGVPEGSYYQIYIDDAEVARTNDNEITLDVSRGDHRLVVRSMDEYGRGLYTSTTFSVEKSATIVIFASIALVISLLVVTYPVWFRRIVSHLKESRSG